MDFRKIKLFIKKINSYLIYYYLIFKIKRQINLFVFNNIIKNLHYLFKDVYKYLTLNIDIFIIRQIPRYFIFANILSIRIF